MARAIAGDVEARRAVAGHTAEGSDASLHVGSVEGSKDKGKVAHIGVGVSCWRTRADGGSVPKD